MNKKALFSVLLVLALGAGFLGSSVAHCGEPVSIDKLSLPQCWVSYQGLTFLAGC
ncbi:MULTISPECIES: hypothetical protein [unclassified Providencia]|uniref:hypothetical protein n=1 Tax=unclassified Providencia TaxID=2633465 RepID=UPI0023498763|nr:MULTISPECIES: hypothetical protein [unclassified Providencia]